MSFWNIFGGGVVDAVEGIAKEWIDTPQEEAEAKYRDAEAKALFIKTLDPNGLMRRDISRKVSSAYLIYLFTTMLLVIAHSFSVGNENQVQVAITSLTDLFVPITTMFTAIVGASFGVNGINSMKAR